MIDKVRSALHQASNQSIARRTLAFGANLLNKFGGSEMRQQKGGDQHGADDSLRTVQSEIAGGADEGKQSSDHARGRGLKQLARADGGCPNPRAQHFVRDWAPPVTEERVT